MVTDTELPIVIVGAGVTGLTSAYRLRERGKKVIVCEATHRVGGNIETAKHDGFLYDLGPDSFLKTKPSGSRLCEDLGLGSEVISPLPGATLVHVARAGKLHPMPEGLSLGVPRRPGPLLSTPLLSVGAKMRALMEPFVRRPSDDPGEETIQQFLARRLGSEMAERLAAPLLSGVFAGDATRLSMNAAFPQLIALEKKHGSLFSGMNGGKSVFRVLFEKSAPHASPFMSLRGGLSDLIEALRARIPEDSIRLGAEVRAVRPPSSEGKGVEIQLDGETIVAAHVVIAGPPWAARPVVQELHEEFDRALGAVSGFSTATVFFGLSLDEMQASLSGSGFIVPPGEADILASTFISSKWEGRAPEGKALIRAFVGGARKDIRDSSDDDLKEIAQRELSRFLGDLGRPEFCRVHRYERGSPQPELGYDDLLRRVRAAVDARPWLSLIGSGYGGAGIPDCIRQADDVAAKLAG